MRNPITLSLTALASVPVVGLAALQATAPAFADTPAQGPACVSQSLNPHPSDSAGATTATLFCATPAPQPDDQRGGPRR